jgi:membrane protein required for colicin V production
LPSFPLTLLDLAVIAVVLISAILAFGRGFVHEALSIAGWIGAAFAVIFLLPVARPFAREFIQPPLLADVAAGVTIFIIAMILLSIVTRAIAVRVHGSALSPVDRSLGFVFGLLRGAVLVCLAYIPVQWLITPQDQPDWLRDAKLLPLVQRGSSLLTDLVDRGSGSATSPGNQVQEQRRKSLETERLVRDMMSPDPKAPANGSTNEPKGYDERERRGIERLLEGSR